MRKNWLDHQSQRMEITVKLADNNEQIIPQFSIKSHTVQHLHQRPWQLPSVSLAYFQVTVNLERGWKQMWELLDRVAWTNLRINITKTLLDSARKSENFYTYDRVILSIWTGWQEPDKVMASLKTFSECNGLQYGIWTTECVFTRKWKYITLKNTATRSK